MVLCALAAAAGAWLAALNVMAARDVLPFAVDGRAVQVTVRSCTGSVCRGDYRVGGAVLRGEEVEGMAADRVGTTVSATVRRSHPGKAVTGDPVAALIEAILIAGAGAAIAVVAGRAGAVRSRQRRRTRAGARASPGAAQPVAGTGGGYGAGAAAAPAGPDPDDPLAWVRRRRFGAGG